MTTFKTELAILCKNVEAWRGAVRALKRASSESENPRIKNLDAADTDPGFTEFELNMSFLECLGLSGTHAAPQPNHFDMIEQTRRKVLDQAAVVRQTVRAGRLKKMRPEPA